MLKPTRVIERVTQPQREFYDLTENQLRVALLGFLTSRGVDVLSFIDIRVFINTSNPIPHLEDPADPPSRVSVMIERPADYPPTMIDGGGGAGSGRYRAVPPRTASNSTASTTERNEQ
ncbi:MAG: hypothetical protein ACRC52_07465 [Aeromonas veronii]